MKTFALLAVCGLAAGAMAEPVTVGTGGSNAVGPAGGVLWEQLPTADPGASAFVDQQFPDFADFSTYLVSDVTVSGGGWNIESVSTFFTNGTGLWPGGVTSAVLNIFDKTGPLPVGGDDPTGGLAVAVTFDDAGVMTAAGLDIDLADGDYWIGLTPDAEFGILGQEFHLATDDVMGDATAGRNPGGAFGLGSDWFDAGVAFGGIEDWDAAIVINGTIIPAPGAFALLGAGGLMLARRRR